MPYGYEKFRLSKNISKETTIHEVSMINSMLSFIDKKYERNIAPHEIRPLDIKDFLDNERSSGLEDSTVNRKLVYIRQWYDYMWQTGKIKHDFMPKLKYQDNLDLSPSQINIDYSQLLDCKRGLLTDLSVTLTSKLIYIFYMRGLRVRDIIKVKSDDFTDNISTLSFTITTQSGIIASINFVDPEEVGVLLAGMERALFRNTPYLFSSKVRNNKNEYGPFHNGSMKDYLKELTEYLGVPFKSGEIRFAYVHYLYSVKNMKLEEIQREIGVSITTSSRILKESLERIAPVDYNVKRTVTHNTN